MSRVFFFIGMRQALAFGLDHSCASCTVLGAFFRATTKTAEWKQIQIGGGWMAENVVLCTFSNAIKRSNAFRHVYYVERSGSLQHEPANFAEERCARQDGACQQPDKARIRLQGKVAYFIIRVNTSKPAWSVLSAAA